MTVPSLSTAIVVWTGWGETPTPARDEARLVNQFGEGATLALLPSIRELERDFYRSEADALVADLKEMGDRASHEFRERHPEISDDAVQALAWCYTYDYK